MASAVELVAVGVIVVFVIGTSCGVILVVAMGIRAEEKLARRRSRARQRATTLYDEPVSVMTRGVRRFTGDGHNYQGRGQNER
jgi:hypothetical protein